jgi:hypothetical protein
VPVKPLSKKKIELICEHYLRTVAPNHLEDAGILDLDYVVTVANEKYFGIHFKIDDELKENSEAEAKIEGDQRYIVFTSRGYDKLRAGDNRTRFTAAHECFHAIVHLPQYIRKSPTEIMREIQFKRRSPIKVYENPEWQAFQGGGAILMPRSTLVPLLDELSQNKRIIRGIGYQVSRIYGVSHLAASKRIEKMAR